MRPLIARGRETQRRLKWEVYNNGLEFEHSIKHARNRLEYEAAFWQNLQNPKARLVDLKPFSLDRITFEMEHLGAPADQKAAAAVRRATLLVWKLMESKLGKFDWDAALDERTKKELDHAVIVFRKDVRNRVRELVCLTEDRPFLSETRCDFTRAIGEIDWHIKYVLHHAGLLVVRFFDEERVILDALGQRLGGDQGTQRQEIRQ